MWVAELVECKRDGLSFDAARGELPPEWEQAWAAWGEAVQRIARRNGKTSRTDSSLVIPAERSESRDPETVCSVYGSRIGATHRPG